MRREKKTPYYPDGEMKRCDRCGFGTRWDSMVFQNGLWLCTERGCVDKEDSTSLKEGDN